MLVRRATGVEDLAIGVDGCGVPVHGMPLAPWPRCSRGLTAPERLGDVAPAADRVTEAMLAEPYLVGGRDRVDTDVMQATGDVVAKSGAEALECAARPAVGPGRRGEDRRTGGAGPPLRR